MQKTPAGAGVFGLQMVKRFQNRLDGFGVFPQDDHEFLLVLSLR
jgi:hypothetical protein